MAKQDRAIRTRRKILEAAAQVFDREGYQAATIAQILHVAGVTKGALYFHFASKEDLAYGVLSEQRNEDAVRPQPVKLQELVDSGSVLAHRLRTDSLVRASIRLTLDQQAQGLDRQGPFRVWSTSNRQILEAARSQGELLPHVDPAEAAELCVGAFAGMQLMSVTLSNYEDLPHRLSVFQRLLLPSIAVPSVLASLDLSEDRGGRLIAEAQARTPADAVLP